MFLRFFILYIMVLNSLRHKELFYICILYMIWIMHFFMFFILYLMFFLDVMVRVLGIWQEFSQTTRKTVSNVYLFIYLSIHLLSIYLSIFCLSIYIILHSFPCIWQENIQIKQSIFFYKYLSIHLISIDLSSMYLSIFYL